MNIRNVVRGMVLGAAAGFLAGWLGWPASAGVIALSWLLYDSIEES